MEEGESPLWLQLDQPVVGDRFERNDHDGVGGRRLVHAQDDLLPFGKQKRFAPLVKQEAGGEKKQTSYREDHLGHALPSGPFEEPEYEEKKRGDADRDGCPFEIAHGGNGKVDPQRQVMPPVDERREPGHESHDAEAVRAESRGWQDPPSQQPQSPQNRAEQNAAVKAVAEVDPGELVRRDLDLRVQVVQQVGHEDAERRTSSEPSPVPGGNAKPVSHPSPDATRREGRKA